MRRRKQCFLFHCSIKKLELIACRRKENYPSSLYLFAVLHFTLYEYFSKDLSPIFTCKISTMSTNPLISCSKLFSTSVPHRGKLDLGFSFHARLMYWSTRAQNISIHRMRFFLTTPFMIHKLLNLYDIVRYCYFVTTPHWCENLSQTQRDLGRNSRSHISATVQPIVWSFVAQLPNNRELLVPQFGRHY